MIQRNKVRKYHYTMDVRNHRIWFMSNKKDFIFVPVHKRKLKSRLNIIRWRFQHKKQVGFYNHEPLSITGMLK